MSWLSLAWKAADGLGALIPRWLVGLGCRDWRQIADWRDDPDQFVERSGRLELAGLGVEQALGVGVLQDVEALGGDELELGRDDCSGG